MCDARIGCIQRKKKGRDLLARLKLQCPHMCCGLLWDGPCVDACPGPKKAVGDHEQVRPPPAPIISLTIQISRQKLSAHRSSTQHAAEDKLALLKQMKAKANAYADTVGVVKKPQSPESKFSDQQRKNQLAAKLSAAGAGQHEHHAL